MLTSEGHLLGGRLIYRQPVSGFRSGIEPVLLAASVPARAGESVLEAGTGAGAALLCLSGRVPGVRGTGVERDAAMAALAAGNARANGFSGIEIIAQPIETAALPRGFDHAMANPPYHPPGGTVSPDARREAAKRGPDSLIADWIERLAALLRDRGTMTLIVPTAMIPFCVASMAQRNCRCTMLFPLWPKPARPAKLVLLRGVKATRSPLRLSAGLLLHDTDGSYSEGARQILVAGAGLDLERAG